MAQKAFIKRVKDLMAASNMTAYRLSQTSGLSQSGLSRLFSGSMNPSLEVIEALAKGLGVEVKDLFDFETEDHGIPPHLMKLMANKDKMFYDAVEAMAKASSPRKR